RFAALRPDSEPPPPNMRWRRSVISARLIPHECSGPGIPAATGRRSRPTVPTGRRLAVNFPSVEKNMKTKPGFLIPLMAADINRCRFGARWLLALVVVFFSVVKSLAQEPPEFVPGQVLVRFNVQAANAQLRDALGRGGLGILKHL